VNLLLGNQATSRHCYHCHFGLSPVENKRLAAAVCRRFVMLLFTGRVQAGAPLPALNPYAADYLSCFGIIVSGVAQRPVSLHALWSQTQSLVLPYNRPSAVYGGFIYEKIPERLVRQTDRTQRSSLLIGHLKLPPDLDFYIHNQQRISATSLVAPVISTDKLASALPHRRSLLNIS
jgi:hypothetical protein